MPSARIACASMSAITVFTVTTTTFPAVDEVKERATTGFVISATTLLFSGPTWRAAKARWTAMASTKLPSESTITEWA